MKGDADSSLMDLVTQLTPGAGGGDPPADTKDPGENQDGPDAGEGEGEGEGGEGSGEGDQGSSSQGDEWEDVIPQEGGAGDPGSEDEGGGEGDPPEDPPGSNDEKAKHAWSNLRKEAAKVKALEARVKELETAGGGEVEALKKQVETLENDLGRANLEQSPKFKKEFDVPLRAKVEDAVRYLMDDGVEEARAKALVQGVLGQTNMAKVVKVLAEEAPATANSVALIIMEAQKIGARRSQAVQEWRESVKAGLAEPEAVGMALPDVANELDSALAELRDTDRFYPVVPTKNEKWNARVESQIDSATAVLKTGSAKQIAKLAIQGATAPGLAARVSVLTAEVARLQKVLADKGISDQATRVTLTRPSSGAPPRKEGAEAKTMDDLVKNILG